MQSLIQREALDELIKVDSAGTSSFHIGEPADKRMRQAASDRGYALTSRSRQATQRDYSRFDLIIAMDRNNYRELSSLFGEPTHKLHLMSEYLPEQEPRDIPDPYYGESDGFAYVLELCEQACPRILAQLLEISRAKG